MQSLNRKINNALKIQMAHTFKLNNKDENNIQIVGAMPELTREILGLLNQF